MIAPYAEIGQDGRVYVIGGDLDTVRVPIDFFPATVGLPLYVAVKIGLPAQECGRQYSSQIEIIAPDGTTLETTPHLIEAPLPDNPQRQSKVGIVLLLAGLTFPVTGEYSVRLVVDGIERARLPLYIDQVAPEQGVQA